MIETLKENYPDAEIDFLVNKRVYELIHDYPNINKVHAIEKDSIKDIKKVCKENKYDIAIVARPLFIIALALFLAGVKYRLGTGYRWYSVLFNIRHYQHRKYSIKHELEYNLDMLDELNCKRIKNVKPCLRVEESDLNKVKEKLLQKGVNITRDFIIIHPASLGSAKTWSVSNFVKLVNLLEGDKSCDLNILITGTKSEETILNAVAGENKDSDKVFIFNDFKIKEFAGLIKLAKLFVSNSTGPIHIAAAVDTFCVGFYSPIPAESAARWEPYSEKKKIFTPTAGKYNYGDIMDSIQPDDVFNFIKSFILNKKIIK